MQNRNDYGSDTIQFGGQRCATWFESHASLDLKLRRKKFERFTEVGYPHLCEEKFFANQSITKESIK